ncbi:MAG: DEAD/DEAH box helicase [Endomicrobium sp.]|jgi:ATP-dependent RNA helicase DeaD|nr:DEAD/DEAH box helicase [Endomicrobium sp.]
MNIIKKFSDLKLSNEIIKAIHDLGFEETTPIQSIAIPKMLDGIDIVAQAQTGTGKTAAFCIPILEKINVKNKVVQTIILCPTRELAIQVSYELKLLSKYKIGVNILSVYGGQPIQKQIYSLSSCKVQIVVGTPGRVIDHLERKTLSLDNVSIVVLDEADKMLDMGFRDDIEIILKRIPKQRQIVFFSATIPNEFMFLIKKYQKNSEIIKIEDNKFTIPMINQYYFVLKEYQKIEAIMKCIDMYNPNLAIIFCNTKRKVDEVSSYLQSNGYSAASLHGDMSQSQRDNVMLRFRNQSISILIATDVAARGIDIDNINVVFNYDIPKDNENYVHRIGRTGRAGKTGEAYSFVSEKEMYKLKNIQRYIKTNIKRSYLPTLNDIEKSRIKTIIKNINKILKDGKLEKYKAIIDDIITNNDITNVSAAILKILFETFDKKNNVKMKENTHNYYDRGVYKANNYNNKKINFVKNGFINKKYIRTKK